MTEAVLKRHGANFDLESPGVQSALAALQDEGLIRLLGEEHAYFKMLGAE